MSLLTRFINIDRRLASSFTGAVVLSIVAFVAGQLYDRKPRLEYEILGQSPVFDVREDVNTLDILFEGRSMRQQHQMLSLLTVKVQNIGNEGINKQVSYDHAALPGFRISNSTIARVDTLDASNEYLSRGLQLSRVSRNEFSFAPIIIDKGDFFVLKFLVVHDESAEPRLEAIGKIANAPATIIAGLPSNDKVGFMSRALGGSLAVQAARLIIYLVGGLVVFGLMIAGIAWLIEVITDRKRCQHVKNFERSLSREPNKAERYILDLYIKYGASAIVNVNQLLANPTELNREFDSYQTRKKSRSSRWKRRITGNGDFGEFHVIADHDFFEKLLENEVLVEAGGKVSPNTAAGELGRTFETFLLGVIPEEMLRIKGEAHGRKGEEIIPPREPAVDHEAPAVPGAEAAKADIPPPAQVSRHDREGE